MNVDDTLNQRGAVYGDYNKGVELEAELMEAIERNYFHHHNNLMRATHSTMISKIIMKLSRLSVSPDHIDSWHDIAGYAELAVKYLKSKED